MITHLKPIHGTEFRCDTRGKQFTGTPHQIAHLKKIQGTKSLKLLNIIVDESLENKFNYFDWIETSIAYEKVIISRTGFTNELGWEIYLRPENDSKKIGDLILEKGK